MRAEAQRVLGIIRRMGANVLADFSMLREFYGDGFDNSMTEVWGAHLREYFSS